MGTAVARSLGLTDGDLHGGSTPGFSAVGRHSLTCRGSFDANVALGPRRARVTVFVIDHLDGTLLSWFDSMSLGLLPADFPAQVQSVVSSDQPPPVPPRRRRHCREGADRQVAPPAVVAPADSR